MDAPFFKKSISIKSAKTVWKKDSGIYNIEKVHLTDK
ncbi:MAG: hypothetical protein ISS36_03955 [Candidatus Aenigmarchaeota archaeon]|nr:hypothetical protein [Candidatus Aenigmarchaeota archaeon]